MSKNLIAALTLSFAAGTAVATEPAADPQAALKEAQSIILNNGPETTNFDLKKYSDAVRMLILYARNTANDKSGQKYDDMKPASVPTNCKVFNTQATQSTYLLPKILKDLDYVLSKRLGDTMENLKLKVSVQMTNSDCENNEKTGPSFAIPSTIQWSPPARTPSSP